MVWELNVIFLNRITHVHEACHQPHNPCNEYQQVIYVLWLPASGNSTASSPCAYIHQFGNVQIIVNVAAQSYLLTMWSSSWIPYPFLCLILRSWVSITITQYLVLTICMDVIFKALEPSVSYTDISRHSKEFKDYHCF